MSSKHVEKVCVLATIALSWAVVSTFSVLLPSPSQHPKFLSGESKLLESAAQLHGIHASIEDERSLDEMPLEAGIPSAASTGVTLIVDDHPLLPALTEGSQ